MSKCRNALVTIVVGAKHKNLYEMHCKASWKKYCDKNDCDLIVIQENLDTSKRSMLRSPAWQKLLILSQEWSSSYEQIAWVDADIVINWERAPSIFSFVPIDKIGCVDMFAIPTKHMNHIGCIKTYEFFRSRNWSVWDNSSPKLYYENRGIKPEAIDKVVQTGVLVASPIYHRMFLEDVYNKYEDQSKGSEWNYEQPALSYELLTNKLEYWLPIEFNLCVWDAVASFYPFVFFQSGYKALPERAKEKLLRLIRINSYDDRIKQQCIKNILELSYFTHFAGCVHLMDYLKS